MSKGKEANHWFLVGFENRNTDIEQNFADIFSEFIYCLNEVDLSEETLENLNGIFTKDMNIFLKKELEKGCDKIED